LHSVPPASREIRSAPNHKTKINSRWLMKCKVIWPQVAVVLSGSPIATLQPLGCCARARAPTCLQPAG
jgi:hypothetical protein